MPSDQCFGGHSLVERRHGEDQVILRQQTVTRAAHNGAEALSYATADRFRLLLERFVLDVLLAEGDQIGPFAATRT
ncbi:MAG: hypothetical protein LC753_05705 [Acidobacteria bacterium]|nr:hypothetical protein [Acidobacteriota bacterium]MCA1649786.1 hypothetical protein [Acidobacteriota bacterium]